MRPVLPSWTTSQLPIKEQRCGLSAIATVQSTNPFLFIVQVCQPHPLFTKKTSIIIVLCKACSAACTLLLSVSLWFNPYHYSRGLFKVITLQIMPLCLPKPKSFSLVRLRRSPRCQISRPSLRIQPYYWTLWIRCWRTQRAITKVHVSRHANHTGRQQFINWKRMQTMPRTSLGETICFLTAFPIRPH